MDMDAAGSICHSSGLDQLPDNVLQILNVFVLKDRRDNLAGVLTAGIRDPTVPLDLTPDTAVAHSLPGAALAICGFVDLVVGSDVAGRGSEVVCNNLGGIRSSNAGQLDFNAEVLILDHHNNLSLIFFTICDRIKVVGVRLPTHQFLGWSSGVLCWSGRYFFVCWLALAYINILHYKV